MVPGCFQTWPGSVCWLHMRLVCLMARGRCLPSPFGFGVLQSVDLICAVRRAPRSTPPPLGRWHSDKMLTQSTQKGPVAIHRLDFDGHLRLHFLGWGRRELDKQAANQPRSTPIVSAFFHPRGGKATLLLNVTLGILTMNLITLSVAVRCHFSRIAPARRQGTVEFLGLPPSIALRRRDVVWRTVAGRCPLSPPFLWSMPWRPLGCRVRNTGFLRGHSCISITQNTPAR